MVDWSQAVQEVIRKTHKNEKMDRLDFLDYLVLNAPLEISAVDQKCRELGHKLNTGAIRDNRFINPVTKIIHGKQRRLTSDSWLKFDQDSRMYTVHKGFAEAWKKARGG